MNPPRPSILVTGGAGYIGAHTTLALLQAGFDVLVLDNLCNSSPESLRRVASIAGRAPEFMQGDIRDADLLNRLFTTHAFSAVLHFAGLKAVGESTKRSLAYYDNNVAGSLCLLQAAARAGVFRFVFSSSATVYGEQPCVPFLETMPAGEPTNPYGRSKLMVEHILSDLADSDARWYIAALRYFNPVGAHESGLIGEDPSGIPSNLMPYITQVAVGRLSQLRIFGNDYPTHDGTGVRDFIHVMDLAEGHVKALQCILPSTDVNSAMRSGCHFWNLGTGVGHSVLDLIHAFELATGCHIPYSFAPRRSGDIAQCWADASKAWKELGWRTRRNLHNMVIDAWRWQSMNPNGYK